MQFYNRIQNVSASFVLHCDFILSQFDEEIFKRWDHAMESGCFKYNLDSVERRIIPGKYNFVAQV